MPKKVLEMKVLRRKQKEQLAIALKCARKATGRTQQRLADESDVSRVLISNIERGNINRVNIQILNKLFAPLGLHILLSDSPAKIIVK